MVKKIMGKPRHQGKEMGPAAAGTTERPPTDAGEDGQAAESQAIDVDMAAGGQEAAAASAHAQSGQQAQQKKNDDEEDEEDEPPPAAPSGKG